MNAAARSRSSRLALTMVLAVATSSLASPARAEVQRESDAHSISMEQRCKGNRIGLRTMGLVPMGSASWCWSIHDKAAVEGSFSLGLTQYLLEVGLKVAPSMSSSYGALRLGVGSKARRDSVGRFDYGDSVLTASLAGGLQGQNFDLDLGPNLQLRDDSLSGETELRFQLALTLWWWLPMTP